MKDLIGNAYTQFLTEIRTRISQAQNKVAQFANRELIILYFDIGKMIDTKQNTEGWGASVIPKLSRDIQNELPEIKGFSKRNIGYMVKFFREYRDSDFLQLPVAKIETCAHVNENPPDSIKLQLLVAQIPWTHNIILIQSVKDIKSRIWYMEKVVELGWSKDILSLMIKSNLYQREGSAVTNFDEKFSIQQSKFAKNILKDPYLFDFMTLTEHFNERELETGLVRHLEKFLIELGQGFSFVGRQYHFEISDKDFYIDLLFYHLKLRSFIVIELKKGDFKPEYAGKVNFYCNIVDDKLKHTTDNQTIGLILCQGKDKIMAEYALRGMDKPIGVSDYELTQVLPKNLQSSLPSIKQIEQELQNETL